MCCLWVPEYAAAWVGAIATFLAVLVALFQEPLRRAWYRPILTVRIQLGPPDCHQTQMTMIATTAAGEQQIVGQYPCYYFRDWVENTGRGRATDVQVFAAELQRRQADGTFRRDDAFLPMNFKWSHSHEVFAAGLSPGMGKHCDIAHVLEPQGAQQKGETVVGVPSGQTVLTLDLEMEPNTRTHLLAPGVYRLLLRIAASNRMPATSTIEITHTGNWYSTESQMFADGIGFRRVS
jgi:hypothetical protein